MNKSSMMQWKVKQEKTLGLSKRIIEEQEDLSLLEMGLSINNTFSRPTMRSVFKDELASISYGVVKILCTRFINSFAFSSKLTPEQIGMLTVDTLESFAYESLEDVIIFFKMARSGKFGNTKRSVDSNLIYGEWCPMYLKKKSQIREDNYNEKKNSDKTENITVAQVKSSYQKYQHHKIIRERKIDAQIFVDKISKEFDKQMLEDTILEWSKDPKKDYYNKLVKKKRQYIK